MSGRRVANLLTCRTTVRSGRGSGLVSVRDPGAAVTGVASRGTPVHQPEQSRTHAGDRQPLAHRATQSTARRIQTMKKSTMKDRSTLTPPSRSGGITLRSARRGGSVSV